MKLRAIYLIVQSTSLVRFFLVLDYVEIFEFVKKKNVLLTDLIFIESQKIVEYIVKSPQKILDFSLENELFGKITDIIEK